MATLTIRNLPPEVVRSLKALAQRHHRSMEQEVREILESQAGDRLSAVAQIERSWDGQARTPSAEEIDSWITTGRR
jgi:plasmid stability protein